MADMVESPPVPRSGVRSGAAAAALLAVTAAFQVALAAGAPWGAAAWGGTHPGVLPAGLRVASAGTLVVYGPLAAVAVGRLGRPATRRRVLRGASGLMVLGAVMNAASPSTVEKVWVPVTAALAVLLWRAAPSADAPSGVTDADGRRP
jgi:hypothetical protein